MSIGLVIVALKVIQELRQSIVFQANALEVVRIEAERRMVRRAVAEIAGFAGGRFVSTELTLQTLKVEL